MPDNRLYDTRGGMLASVGREIISRRHPEWREHQLTWRWLMDSFEGGDRYRQAIYGTDSRGLPVRNLVRHKREYPSVRERTTTIASYLGGTATGLAGLVGDASVPSAGLYDGSPRSHGSDYAARAADGGYALRRGGRPAPPLVGAGPRR